MVVQNIRYPPIWLATLCLHVTRVTGREWATFFSAVKSLRVSLNFATRVTHCWGSRNIMIVKEIEDSEHPKLTTPPFRNIYIQLGTY